MIERIKSKYTRLFVFMDDVGADFLFKSALNLL